MRSAESKIITNKHALDSMEGKFGEKRGMIRGKGNANK